MNTKMHTKIKYDKNSWNYTTISFCYTSFFKDELTTHQPTAHIIMDKCTVEENFWFLVKLLFDEALMTFMIRIEHNSLCIFFNFIKLFFHKTFCLQSR